MLIVFVSEKLFLTLLKFAQERLTAKQKAILNILVYNPVLAKKPVTQVVGILNKELNSSLSTIWLNLNQLKRIQLVDYGSFKSKGRPIKLTEIGKFLARNLNKSVGSKYGEKEK